MPPTQGRSCTYTQHTGGLLSASCCRDTDTACSLDGFDLDCGQIPAGQKLADVTGTVSHRSREVFKRCTSCFKNAFLIIYPPRILSRPKKKKQKNSTLAANTRRYHIPKPDNLVSLDTINNLRSTWLLHGSWSQKCPTLPWVAMTKLLNVNIIHLKISVHISHVVFHWTRPFWGFFQHISTPYKHMVSQRRVQKVASISH